MTPKPVQITRAILALVTLSHLAIPIVMWLRRDDLSAEIARAHPELGQSEVDAAADIALRSAAIFHLALLILTAYLVVKLTTGKAWVRRLTTISQALAVIFSAVSWSTSTMFHTVIPIIDLLQIIAIALLWAPQSARDFFHSRHPGQQQQGTSGP